MAIQSILRKSISNAAPLATRFIGASRTIHSAAAVSALKRTTTATVSPRLLFTGPYSAGRRFLSTSTITAYDEASPDKKLLQVLQYEIDIVELNEDHKKCVAVPDDFPFKIEDNPGEQTVKLRGEYDDETITIEVSMPNLVTGEEDEGEVDDEDAQTDSRSKCPLLVNVTKKNGNRPPLEFHCTAFPDEIRINALLLKNPETEDHNLAYEGPDFLDLDENLQKAFHKYLEIRGLKPINTNFLHEYMIDKDEEEYVRWLQEIKKFVQA